MTRGHDATSPQANQPWDMCMVLGCGLPAQQTWTTRTAWRSWTVEWMACQAHYAKLQADHDWTLVHGQPPDWRRWILMGNDAGRRSVDIQDDQPSAHAAGTSSSPVDFPGQDPSQHLGGSAPWGGAPPWGRLFPPGTT